MFVRNPDLLLCWRGSRLLIRNLQNGKTAISSPEIVSLLNSFSRPQRPMDVVRRLKIFEAASVSKGIARLKRLGFLLPAKEAKRERGRLLRWKWNLASAHYHVASRDLRYLRDPALIDAFLRQRLASEHRPSPFRRYSSLFRVKLPRDGAVPLKDSRLDRVLGSRRTVRDFQPTPVSLSKVSSLVRGTWGMTGWLDAPPIGRLLAKTSPSAGSLHPIECYLIAWRVTDLKPGVYHYDVRGDEFRLLRVGDLRREAVRAASGQSWIRRAAFLCVMTAVFQRTLWKYNQENAYRVIWMDAGHLAQTFCLLATSLGLGPFTTAAIQDSYIEKLIGLDGIKEFPVYLCGAGVPAKKPL